MSKRVDATSMTTEASNTEATKSRPAPAFRKPNQTRAARQRKEMIADFVAALGGVDRVSPIVMTDIERAVDMTMLALDMRRRALRGDKVAITDLTRLEGAADRAVRRLRLPATRAIPHRPESLPPPMLTLSRLQASVCIVGSIPILPASALAL
jgi:hypothetical protein